MALKLAQDALDLASEIDDEDDPTGKRRELLLLSSIAESLHSIAKIYNYQTNREDIF